MKKVNLIGWFSYKDINVVFEDLKKVPVLKSCPIYEEAPYDEAHKEAIIQELIKHNYIICGDTHQAEDFTGIPVFDDGYIMLSMRSWGDLMAEAQNIKENTDKYKYMDFYMASICKLEERIPGESYVQNIQETNCG